MDNKEMKVSTAAKREKKEARRVAKAERKAANQVEEKKSRPNNLLLGIMILGVVLAMFLFVKGYNYYKLDPSIEKYIENNGGAEAYSNMMIDQYTTAAITAKENSMTITLDTTAAEDQVETLKEFYGGDDWEDQMRYIGAYFLTSMKPLTRGLSGDVTVVSNINGEEVKSVSMTLKEAKKELKEQQEEAEKAAEESAADKADAETDAADDAAADDADSEAEDEG